MAAKTKCQSCFTWNCTSDLCKRWLAAERNGLVRLESEPDESLEETK